MSMTERERRRRERLRVELADEEVDLGLDEGDPRHELVLDEIAYARQPPVHERRRNPYGALIITDEDYAMLTSSSGLLTSGRVSSHVGSFLGRHDRRAPAEGDLPFLRLMCDGHNTFLVRTPAGPGTLFEFRVPADELLLSRSRLGVAVQRTDAGAVKIFTSGRITTFDEGEWTAKPYAADAVRRLFRLFLADVPKPFAGTPPISVLDQLLAFCLHVLSPRHIGATLIWRPASDTDWAQSRHIADPGVILPARVRFNASFPPPEKLATLLSVSDGAGLVGPGGHVERVQAKLTASDRAIRLVRAEGGLRHTSAKRYSFDDPDSLVFVVSHDGPVTVYSDGVNVLQLRAGPTARATEWADPASDDDTGPDRVRCAGCERRLTVDGLPSTADCPICGRPGVATRAHAWPVKPWSR